MAWYYGEFSCGHEGRVNITGINRGRRIEYAFSKPCEECRAREFEEFKEKQNARADELAKEMGLPELKGSEKQVAWAKSIRQSFLDKADEKIADVCSIGDNVWAIPPKNDEKYIYYRGMIQWIINAQTDSRFYIKNKDNLGYLLQDENLNEEYKKSLQK